MSNVSIVPLLSAVTLAKGKVMDYILTFKPASPLS